MRKATVLTFSTGDDGVSALCYAAQSGHVEIIRLLTSYKARVSNILIRLNK